MGRSFANREKKMAKTNAAYSKKAAFIGKKVVIAVKSGGDDPSTNLALAAIMREANALNVPKDVIDRNIKKAMDPVTADYKEMTYEAYGAGGVGLIINCLSDNSNRVTADVTSTVNKAGLKMASSGSVLFNFNRKGRLALQKELRQVSTSLETPPLFAPHFSRHVFARLSHARILPTSRTPYSALTFQRGRDARVRHRGGARGRLRARGSGPGRTER